MISFKNFGLSLKYLIFLLLSLSYISCAPVSVHLNQKLCSFKAGDYSLQWAYEPQSKNVVFVLKQKSELNNFWTGVGFGDRKKGIIDFIGVFVKNGQIGIADTHIIPDDGTLTPDASTNVQSIAFDYHNKSVTAKFARALKSPDDKFDQDLDNCQTFNFAINGGSISRSGIVPDFDEIAEKRICDIDKNCIVDIRQHLKPSESPSPEATSKSDAKLFSDPKNVDNDNEDDLSSTGTKKIIKPEFAESVDISGTGDPCSFAGVGYTVNWTYSPETGMVEFSMKHPIRMGKWWSAVGIGDTMADMDIAIMFISSGRPKRIRDYFSKSYTVPEEDEKQDWILSRHRTKSVDEMIELGFSRKLETDDSDKDRSLDGCVLFQFAANAGHYGSGFAVRKHEEWPDLYKACDIKKHCVKKETESNESKEGGEEEISESNDDDVIDEADDESGEVISVKKRTKAKQESRRQLDSSQIENVDGTSTTNVVIQLPGATFSTSVPSENDEGITEAGSAKGVTAASNESGEQAATTPSSVEGADAQGRSESDEKGEEEQGPTTASFEAGQNLRTAAEDAEASPGPTTVSGVTIQDLRTASEGNELNQGPTTISGETAEGLQANTVTEIPNALAENNSSASEGSNNEGETTTLSPDVTTASATTIETTTFAANVTQMPVHIMPIVGGELNSTMLIPGMDDPDFGESSLGGVIEVNRTLDGNETLAAQGNDTDAVNPTTTTLEPAFGIQSTFADRPTTISSGESGISNADVTSAPRRAGEENTEVENSVTDATSTSEGFGESTGLRNILPVTLPLNNNFKPTVSTKLVSLEELESDKETTTEDGLSVGKNQVETVTVPSEITNKVAEAGKELTDLANSLNNTEIEVEVTTAASESGETNIGNGRGNVGEGEITTPGDVEILPETNDAEGTTPESSLNNELNAVTTGSPDGLSEEKATTISSGSGQKGNKGKNNGKSKSNEILKDPTSGPNESETENNKVSSDVTTASGIAEATTAAAGDDSDLTGTSAARIATNENEPSADESTTPSSETTESSESQGTTRIDSDANGSTVAIGTLPEIISTDETKTTVPGVTPLKVVIGGDSNEAGDTTENLIEILSTTVTRAGNGLRDSAVTDSLSSLAATTKVTSPTSLEATTPAAASSESSETTSEIEGSGEASSPTATSDAAAATTPIPGPFDHHKQQLIDELGKEAVGNPKEGCGEGHEDYSQCTTYFKNYLARVQIWADENHERMEDQYGKACTLLSAVQNVTTLCCSIFVETCKGKIEF